MKKILLLISLLASFAFIIQHKQIILANLGSSEAQYSLAKEYFEGKNGHVEFKIALKWCEKAAINGHPKAQYRMGLEEGEGFNEGNSKKAVNWFEKAARQGHAEAMIKLGEMYSAGTGVIKDEKKAMDLFLKAIAKYEIEANFGDSAAAAELGAIYNDGRLVAKDPTKTFEWTKIAANLGNANCQWRLAEYLETGKGTKVDLFDAYKWYCIATTNLDPMLETFAIEDRDRIEKILSPEQVVAARELARNWQPSKVKN